MIAVVLAGGYAKRLWPLTIDKPKALLPIAGKPMINYVVEKLTSLNPPMRTIVVSTNLKFHTQFEKWLETSEYQSIELVPESSSSEEEKLGSVRALADIVEKTAKEDILVLAGDNLFADKLDGFLRFFYEKHNSTVALYHARSKAEVRKGSSVAIDESGRILEFVEKPRYPKTTLVGACVYAFPVGISRRFREYLDLGLPTDEPGRFIEWLHKKETVYGYMLNCYLWDIGTISSYKAADEFFAHDV